MKKEKTPQEHYVVFTNLLFIGVVLILVSILFKDTVRDELLHTVACKAAIKAGWHSDKKELLVLVKEVMSREDLKYCPHGRPICITLSKKQLEKQFKRT